jgi:predicted O-methyltransferase YrrM
MEIMNFSKKIWEYIEAHSSPEDSVLENLNRHTYRKVVHPRMLSGQVQGKLLEFISRMIQPSYILEIGTYTGYSAICMARGLRPEGKLITIEINDELSAVSEKYFSEAGLNEQIKLITGNAIDIIPSLEPGIDLVFMDAEKEQYSEYFDLVFPKIKVGGFILADNTLWDGKVAYEDEFRDSATSAIRDFNEMIRYNPEVENIILPLRDGISLIRKISDGVIQ